MENENMQNQNIDVSDASDKSGKSKGVKALILILVIVLVAGLLFKFLNKIPAPGESKEPVISDKLPENYHTQVTPQNQYPQGFSQNLVVKEGSPEWQRGEDTIAADGKRLKVVELIYRKTEPAALTPLFEGAFKNDKWVIDSTKNNASPVVRVFDKGYEIATLTILKMNDTDSLVNITISTK